jgi:Ca-activated chloride channel homolog
MRFHDTQWLVLLLLLIPWMLGRRARARKMPALAMADGAQLAALPDTLRARCARWLPWLRLLLLVLAILALARPQLMEREIRARSEGVDLVVALDLSTSMLAEDLWGGDPGQHRAGKNRLAIAKEVLAEFLRGRPGDRIGLVAFAARPYPAAPLTLDHVWLQAAVTRLQSGAIEDGTALGDAILAALNRLRSKPAGEWARGQAKSQAIILVTDGRSNAGQTEPLLAAAAARTLGIRVHTIGIGSRGDAVIPMQDPLGGILYRRVAADLDEATLRAVAATTGGGYFRADDREGLARVFREIDRLEKRPLERTLYFAYRELFPGFLIAALAVGFLELALQATLFRRLP